MKQDYVIEVPGQYPRRCTFNIFGEDRIKQLNIQQGEQNVTIQFDIDAHEYNGRWFNEIRAFNIIRGPIAQSVPAATTTGAAPAAPFAPQQPQVQPTAQQAMPFPPEQPAGDEATDDLPF